MNDEEWLQSLKTDSTVLVVSRGGWAGPHRELLTVDKVTRTQVVVRGKRYRKKDGRLCGDRWGGRLEQPTREVLKEMDEERRRNAAMGIILDRVQPRSLSEWDAMELVELEKIARMLVELISREPKE